MKNAFPEHNLRWGALLILLGLVFAVYAPALHFDLLMWDDDINIQNNPHLTGISLESLKWMFTELAYQQRYQPLAWVTWSTIFEIQGLNPFGYHAVVVFLHLANTALVYLLALRLLGGRISVALVAASLWSLHPMRVETVAWAVELLYVQALFFLLLGYLAYLEAIRTDIDPSRRKAFYWASVAGFAFSLFTFPLAFGFVPVLVATDVYLCKRLKESPREWLTAEAKRVWLEKVPFVALTLLAVGLNVVSRVSATQVFSAPVSLENFGVFPRAMQAFYVWAYYVWRPLWPVDLTPVPTQLIDFNPMGPVFIGSVLLVLGLTGLAFYWRKRWPALWVVWIVHLCLLVPMLGLSEHPHTPSDRYSLIISIGWALLVAAGWGAWRARTNLRGVPETVALVLVASLINLSVIQVPLWTNNYSFFNGLLVKLGKHPFRFNILWRLGVEHQLFGDWARADAYFDEALRMQPQNIGSRIWLADWQAQRGRYDMAWSRYHEVLRIAPTTQGIHARIGQIMMIDGQYARAADEFREELKHSPPELELSVQLFIATVRDGKIAEGKAMLQRMSKQFQMTGRMQLECSIALADGYAIAKDFEQAIAMLRIALDQANEMGLKELAGQANARIKLWEEAQSKAKAQPN